jgi:hypothetical protein
MQQVLQGVGETLVQESIGRMRPRGLLLQARHAFALEGAQVVVHGPDGTAQVASNSGSTLAAGAGQ